MENKEKVNVLDNLLKTQETKVEVSQEVVEETQEPTNEEVNPTPAKNQSGVVVCAWTALAFSMIFAPVGVGIGIYAYLGAEDNKEIKVVSLSAIGISAFICLITLVQWIISMM